MNDYIRLRIPAGIMFGDLRRLMVPKALCRKPPTLLRNCPYPKELVRLGAEEALASEMAQELPRHFEQAIVMEWRDGGDRYQVLEQYLKTPFTTNSIDIATLRQCYLQYIIDAYHSVDFKGIGDLVRAIERSSGLSLAATYVPVKATRRPIGETWRRDHTQSLNNGVEMVRDKAMAEHAGLMTAINTYDDICRLAGNPLLLTILALIKRQGTVLPNRRVQLYELYLKTLLEDWPRVRSLNGTSLAPDSDYIGLWQVLVALGLWIREQSPHQGLVEEKPVREFLARWYREQEGYTPRQAKTEAQNFFETLHRHSSLLLEKGDGRFGFIHQTFGEYLAGCGLAEARDGEKKLLERLHDPSWHEAILLGIEATGVASRGGRDVVRLLDTLLSKVALAKGEGEGEAALIAGKVLRDVGSAAVGRAPVASRITSALIETLQSGSVTPLRRRLAGILLGEIGWRPVDLDRFLPIYGDAVSNLQENRSDTPLPRFLIATYPVANYQFRVFWESGAYQQKEWWDDEGWSEGEQPQQPRYWHDADWNSALLPVVGITYWEARAYCRWLDVKLHHEGFEGANGKQALDAHFQVRLPTEAEWDLAAGCGDGRRYPWGQKFDPSLANTEASDTPKRYGIKTTAVCTFPGGKSPVGVWDMVGNVAEVTNDLVNGAAVWLGGSWIANPANACCMSSDRTAPDLWHYYRGFRVVLASIIVKS